MSTEPDVAFHERMAGWVGWGDSDPELGFRHGRVHGTSLAFELDIRIADVARFLADPEHWADAAGFIEAAALGGRRAASGAVSLLAADPGDARRRIMHYVLHTQAADGRRLRLDGFKYVKDEPGFDAWPDTTTLFVTLREEGEDTPALAAGRLAIGLGGFLSLFLGMFRRALRFNRPDWQRRVGGTWRYACFFAAALWTVYVAPKWQRWRQPRRLVPPQRPVPLFTLAGVPGATITTRYVQTDDGLTLALLRFQAEGTAAQPQGDAVLVHHGLTSSSDMFIMPEHHNLVQALHAAGFADVWCFDARTSARNVHNLRRHRDTLDDVALFDHPAAVQAVRAAIGPAARLHVIAHCVGALTFMMSLFGRQVEGIASVVCNSVALTPRVAWWSRLKLAVAPFLVEYVLSVPYVSPRWIEDPGLTRGELFARIVSWLHRECDQPACHMLSMMWGSGGPALFEHANLDPRTHARLGDLFGGTSMHYHRHIYAMVRRRFAGKFRRGEPRHAALPDDYFEYAREMDTPVLFLTGERNNVFADSNPHCYELLYALDPPAAAAGRYTLHVVRDYGHQDVFMGRDSARDVFPHLVAFLNRHRGGARP